MSEQKSQKIFYSITKRNSAKGGIDAYEEVTCIFKILKMYFIITSLDLTHHGRKD